MLTGNVGKNISAVAKQIFIASGIFLPHDRFLKQYKHFDVYEVQFPQVLCNISC